MRTSCLNWRTSFLPFFAFFLLLVRPACAFEYTYSPSNILSGAMFFNGAATNLADRFQLTPYDKNQKGALILENIPKTPVKSFTAQFGLRMANVSSTEVMADGISFNFGPDITKDSVADEKGITKGLAVAFDTYTNTISAPSYPGAPPDSAWVAGISIRWNGTDLASTNIASIFNSLKTSAAFHDVTITLLPPASLGGLSTVTVQYQGVQLSAQIDYSPTTDQTWRMMLAARTGDSKSEHAVNQIHVTGLAAELTVVSPFGAGQTSPTAGTYQLDAFEYTYDPFDMQPGVMIFNGSAAYGTNLFLITPKMPNERGSIVLNNLPQVPISEFTARVGLRMTNASPPGTLSPVAFNYTYDPTNFAAGSMTFNGTAAHRTNLFLLTPKAIQQQGSIVLNDLPHHPITNFTATIGLRMTNGTSALADGVSFNIGPGITTNSTPDETGLTNGLAVSFNTYHATDEPNWVPGLAIRWKGAYVASTNLSMGSSTNFNDAIITLQGPNTPDGLSTVTVQYLGHTLSGQIAYAPASDETWGVAIGARCGGIATEQSINRIRFSGTVLAPAPTSTNLAEGVSFSFGPGIGTNSLPDETGLTNGLAVSFDTYRSPGESAWVPGMAIRWKGAYIATTNIGSILDSNGANTGFTDAVITLQQPALPGQDSTVTVQYQGITLRAQVAYAPASNEVWGVVIGGRTGDYSSEQSINRIQLSGTAHQITPVVSPVGDRLTPSPGIHEFTEKNDVVFQAPQYVYLDRYRRELDPTPENIRSIAHYRARLEKPAATVTPSGGDPAYSIDNGASINLTRDTTVTWHWVIENLAEVDSGTGGVTNLSATDITDAAHTDTLGRRYLTPGTTGFDSLVFRSVNAALQGNVRFGSRGYVMENAPNSPERYLELAGEGDHLRATVATPILPAGTTSYTIEFWARRNLTADTSDQVVLGLGSLNGAGQRLLAGFGGDRGFFISDGATRVSALPGWTDEGWHHWAAVYRGNGASNSVALYRDGVLVQQSSTVFAPFNGNNTVTIGAREVADYATAYFSGGVNNLRIWNRALERTNLYVTLASRQIPSSAPGLRLEMPFDTPPTNSAPGVHVERLVGPAGITNVADLATRYVVQDIYTTNNFLLPSTTTVPSGNTTAWHHRSRLVSASGGRYAFSLLSSGIAQLWVDGQLLINQPTKGTQVTSVTRILSPGGHILETWVIDPADSRSLSLTYSPAPESTGLATIPDDNLSLAASDLLAQDLVTLLSTEGNGHVFVARGFEKLFPANTAGSTVLATLLPGFRLGLTTIEGGQNSVQIDPIGKAPLNDWRRVFWGWNKEFQFKVGASCVEEVGVAAITRLPYFAGDVAEANVDGSTSDTSIRVGAGAVNVLELWLREGERLSVGTLYRTPDRRYTLDGINGNLNSFSEITLDKLIDAVRPNGIARQYDLPAVFGPGSLNFTYARTKHRVNIAIGQGFDASSLNAINAVLTPALPDGVTNLLLSLNGPSANNNSNDIGTGSGGNGQGWIWDHVGKRWFPTRPGVFTLTWPDVAGYTNTIEVSSDFPGDTLTRRGFVGFENPDGTRQGSATNQYLATTTLPAVPNSFSAAPTAHYLYNLPLNGVAPAPADLDPDPADAWFFKEFSYAEKNSAIISKTRIFTDTRAGNRSVLVFTSRPNASERPTGDLTRESVTVRILEVPESTIIHQATATVGSRLESVFDTAGFHSGRITPDSQNFNPLIYNADSGNTVGQWGPIYPVNYYSLNPQVGQPLNVDWYSRADVGAVLPTTTVIYTHISWPDANSITTPVIYLSSQMGSEGVGQAVSTNDVPNYQEILDPARYPNLTIYNQPDRDALGYNPNEEHAFIAPSKAYVLTGDPRFNLSQSAAYALQTGLNNSDTNSTSYTSDPFVLVQYGIPGATNASDAYAMKAYAVKVVRTNDTAQPFPALDRQTYTAFDANGQPVPQPANPRYHFHYNAIAGQPVIPPHPLNLAIGNAVLTNTIGGNLGNTRALWQDRTGNRWAVAGDGRFFQRYWYPLRAGFWLGNTPPPIGTPVAWVPDGVSQGDTGAFLNSSNLAVASSYDTYWGDNYPVLKKGETLTYAGGEYKADHPANPGLPAVLNMASAEVVFDSETPSMTLSTNDFEFVEPANRYYKFEFEATRGGSADPYIQLAEMKFYQNGRELTNSITVSNPGGSSPLSEVPSNLVDGTNSTKWLDLRFTTNSGSTVVLDFGVPVFFNTYKFVTGNDIPDRDPKKWALSGSTDGNIWKKLVYQNSAELPRSRATESAPFTLNQYFRFNASSARVTRPLDRYAVSISREAIPEDLQPANTANVLVSGSRWYFKQLPASLGKRFYYDSLAGQLVFRGRLNDLESGDPKLTQQPVQSYVLEPNFLTEEDVETLIHLPGGDYHEWTEAIEELHTAASTEFTTGDDFGLGVVAAAKRADVVAASIPFYKDDLVSINNSGVGDVVPASSLGIGSALVGMPRFFQKNALGRNYICVAENNDTNATGGVALHIIQLSQERYRGSITVLTPQDAFSEKINLKHTGDFGGNTAEIYYQWYVRDVVNLPSAGTPDGVNSNAWQIYQQGLGLNAIEFSGRPDITLADKLFVVRYGGKEELQEADHHNIVTNGVVSAASWLNVLPDDPAPDWASVPEEPVPFQWAGAANSPQLQADGSRRYIPQLVMGWVKRILDQINPYEARYSATFNGDAPATYSSMLQQAGGPYIGPVALNSDKSNLESVGLIALYETVLQRAKNLTSAPGSANGATDQAILLAATRLAFLYQLLGSEAFSDSQNSVVPQSADSSVALSLNAFAFKNEVANPLQEELALLRGTDFLSAYPAFNRLSWNYFKSDGEAYYNATYNISDANSDGLINESDAAIQYPMGHGDAWGHYLSATKMHYELLRRPGYGWLAQPDFYSLLDNVLPVDYLDEKSFATIAADKVRAGSTLLKATYRDAYVSDPAGQWQGYEDTAQPARAWGVSEWSRRIGQGAWFDWLAVNAVTPAYSTNVLEGLARIDRSTTMAETASVAAGLAEVQQIVDQANRGNNPLGLDADAMTFQAEPYYNGISWERMPPFKQSLDKAIDAANNAVAAYEFASQANQQLRRIADDTAALKREVLLQDLDYKNRLIAIYGRPYRGTVGPGKIFAEGYDGPDLVTFLYMDVVNPHDLRPQVQGDFLWQWSLDNDVVNFGNGLDFQTIMFQPETGDPDGDQVGDNQNQGIFDGLFLTKHFGHLILNTPNHPHTGHEGDTVLGINLPITEMADVALQAPSDWGSRPAYGSIQSSLNNILATQVSLEIALEGYNDYVRKVQLEVFSARQKMDALREKSKFRSYYQTTFETLQIILFGLETQFAAIAAATNTIDQTFTITKSAAAKDAGGGIIAPGFAAVIAASDAAEITSKIPFYVAGKAATWEEKLAELAIKTQELAESSGKETIESYSEFLEVLHHLAETLSEEEGQRGKLMAPIQSQNWAEVMSTLAQGERLQLERTALNRQIAAKAQRNRYADLVTRINRTEAMRKYDQALDNALRYAWLAVKTYDYETSLSDSHPASARALLDQIVKTRSLGNWAGGEPRVGNGGLAEILGQVSANYNALKGQIGLNNSQGEANILSLRSEMMRISPSADSNQRWKDALGAARVADLWQVPEFREYCRPFAVPSSGPQPGLVLEFSTEIAVGKNFFGRRLSGLDHAFSPANYATKVRAFTAAFQNYDMDPAGSSPQLSISPRFYLVPVGLDRQYCSDTEFPSVRSWDVVSQRIPVPYILNPESLGNYTSQLTMDGRDGYYAERIRIGDSRAFISVHGLSGSNDMTMSPLPSGWNSSSRLYGRSAWNTRWLLIVPGATLSADKDAGLDRFINTVTDIKLYLETYSNQGM